ncbi:MAG: hypothetical protein WHT63_09325 [Tepidiforma sp.]
MMRRGQAVAAAGMLALVLAPQVVSQFRPGLHAWLIDHWALTWDLAWREPWRIVLSSLVQPRPGLVGTEWLFALAVVPAFAVLWPARLMPLGFWGADAAGTWPTLLGLRVAAEWSNHAARLLGDPDAGSSAGLFGLALMAAWRLPRTPAAGVVAGIVIFAAGRLAIFHRVFDIEHALAVGTVTLLLWLTQGPPGRPRARAAETAR